MDDLAIWQRVQGWLNAEQGVWLCTVLSTWGSAPRPAGAQMACVGSRPDQVVGSLSGGCVEADLLERLAAGAFRQAVTRYRYGDAPGETERFRLPCGGVLDIAIEYWVPGPATLAAASAVVDALEARQRILLSRDFTGGTVVALPVAATTPALSFEPGSGPLTRLQQVLGPAYRLLLLGASDVSRAVAQLALMMDYEVLVCDPRPDFLQAWAPHGVQAVTTMPDEAVQQFADDPRCAVLALAHDPRIDDMGLMDAFGTRAFYIGAMGSQRTSARRRERLVALGIPEQDLARLHAPAGLDTGSRTPMEIAVSILAGLTAARNGKAG